MDIKIILIAVVVGVFVAAHFRYGRSIGEEALIAFLIALFWTSWYPYTYIGDNNIYILEKINLFPLVLQAAGLVFLREVYKRMPPDMNYFLRFIFITLFAWSAFLLAEVIGIYFLGIKAIPFGQSLFGTGILQIPLIAKLYYFLVGPAYILITNYLRVK